MQGETQATSGLMPLPRMLCFPTPDGLPEVGGCGGRPAAAADHRGGLPGVPGRALLH